MDESWDCWMNLYSAECYPRMIKTFRTSPSGDFLAGEWANRYDTYDFWLLFFSWPFFLLLWVIEAVVFYSNPEMFIPPSTSEGYEKFGARDILN